MSTTARKVMKWIGIVLGSAVVLVLMVIGFFYWKSERILTRKYDYKVTQAVYAPVDAASIARGKHLAWSYFGCVDCHGGNFGGAKVVDAMPFARIYGPNLTRGHGGLGVGHGYDIKAFDRAVRHGITRDGRPIFVMPSYHYAYISDDDLAALFVYLQTLPPAGGQTPPFQLGPVGRMLVATGKFPLPCPDMIDHNAKRPAKAPYGPTAEYGRYIANVGCTGCHGPNLSGGPIYGGDPSWPPASNITRGGALADYTYEDFRRLMTEGLRPGGNPVSEVMPIRNTAMLTEEELQALWLYLQALPAEPYASATWYTTKTP